ncbi:hypothetical protein Tco_1318110 [Tanacetum coccineum]
MLEKSMYDSWASRICLFIKRKKHGRMILDSIDNGPLVYLTSEENGQTRPKKYSELTEAQQLQDDYDVQATNIILHGLPPDVYALVNHQKAAKDIWDRVKMLMNGTELSYQDCEYRLYNLFDKFAHVPVNTKFLNALSSEWSKFVTDVKLAKSLYTTNYDQFQLSSSIQSISVTTAFRLFYVSTSSTIPTSLCSTHSSSTPSYSTEFPQLDSGLVVPMFQQGEDPIKYINKAMAFVSASYAGTGNRGIATASKEVGHILDEEQLAFLADPGISEAPVSHQIIPQNSAFQTYDMDVYDSDCDDLSSAKAMILKFSLRNTKLTAFQQEIDTLKETLSNNVKEKESLSKTLTVFKIESKEKESKYIDKEKQNKELENIFC